MKSSSALRRALVAKLERAGHIKAPGVRRAFLAVPRDLFVPDFARERGLEAVYEDQPIVTKTDRKGIATSSSSQPAIMAIMLEMLDLKPGHRVLEIGAGTGYNAALISEIVGARGRVTAIDIDRELVAKARTALRRAGRRARIVVGDGRLGWNQDAPYDRIIVTASSPDVPRAWWEQLAEEGLLEFPLRLDDMFWGQTVVAFRRTAFGFESVAARPGGFMGLRRRADAPAVEMGQSSIINVVERVGTTTHVLASLNGPAIARLQRSERRKVAAALLGHPRARRIASRRQAHALQMFLTLAIPRQRVVSYSRKGAFGIGVVARGGAAVVVRRGGVVVSEVYGDGAAARELQRALGDWRASGRPGDRELSVNVYLRGRAPRAWRTLKRGRSTVTVDWRRRRR